MESKKDVQPDKSESTKEKEEKGGDNNDQKLSETTKDSSLAESEGLKSSPQSDDKSDNVNPQYDEANMHYEDGVCIYTEPESKCQYFWDEAKQEWMPRSSNSSFSDKDYEFDGKAYTYTDKETNIKYAWNDDKKEWVPADSQTKEKSKKDGSESEDKEDEDSKQPKKEVIKQDMTKGKYGYENGTHTYTDPSDGTVYFWDKEKSAWFPKVDDDFLAQYQMSYGFVDPNEQKDDEKTATEPPSPPPPVDTLKRKAPQEPAWFEVGQESTKVYVSGLPLDITEAELVEVMQKCGLVMRDLDSGKMKIKIYLDPATSLPKGDALCTYIKKESVELALDLIDGSEVRGHRIHVERAKFTMKGDAYDPSLKPKKKRKKDKEKLKKIQEKLFDWRPDKMRGERSNHEKTVIIKNLFDPKIFEKDVKLILEYQQDLREECLKCGSVKKVVIYDRHPEGVAQVNFKEFEAADACIQLLHNRWFGQRQISAELWDGKTRYKISETDEEIKARMAKWEKFLESGEAAEGKKEKENEIKEELLITGPESEEKKDKSDEEIKEDMDTERDSDGTRSSVGSDYETDEEAKP